MCECVNVLVFGASKDSRINELTNSDIIHQFFFGFGAAALSAFGMILALGFT